MFSEVSVIVSIIGLMPTQSLLILVTARSVHILLECFLVAKLSLHSSQTSPKTFHLDSLCIFDGEAEEWPEVSGECYFLHKRSVKIKVTHLPSLRLSSEPEIVLKVVLN